MFFKGVILDLDDTLYNYTTCHDNALKYIARYIENLMKENNTITYNVILDTYDLVNTKLKNNIGNTASSHNRYLYFQHIFELCKVPYIYLNNVHDLYWTVFYEHMIINTGVVQFLKWCAKNNIKICILTDFLVQYQIVKLSRLDILHHIDCIVTSEETGRDKPASIMFHTALHKLNMKSHEVVMIGDDYLKDVVGAVDCGIYAFHYTSVHTPLVLKNNRASFSSFSQLLYMCENTQVQLDHLRDISKYCGERFDLVQAGGGNVSVKCEQVMFIKASGFLLSQVTPTNGYATTTHNFNDYTPLTFSTLKPSIETPMHVFLKKYVVHLHPIQVNRITIKKNAREILKKLFPTCLVIDYQKPGQELANKIQKLYIQHNIIFLLNHGIIITNNSKCDLIDDLNHVITVCENYNDEPVDTYTPYKLCNRISKIITKITQTEHVTIVCQDKIIQRLKHNYNPQPTSPDQIVYCGKYILKVCDLNLDVFEDHMDKYKSVPVIVMYNNWLYITAKSIAKCKEIEDVLKANMMVSDNEEFINYLQSTDIEAIENWDAEKYRINLNT